MGAEGNIVRAELARQRELSGVDIGPEHACSLSLQQGNRDLADEPEPNDQDAFAKSDFREPNPFQRNRANASHHAAVADRNPRSLSLRGLPNRLAGGPCSSILPLCRKIT